MNIRPPLRDHAVIVVVVLDLQVDQRTACPARRAAGHQFKAQRLEPQKHLGVQQRTRVNE